MTYTFKEPMKIPKGSILHVESIYDNSSENPNQPNNPPKKVTWSEQTTDEMFLLIVGYTVDGAAPGGRSYLPGSKIGGFLH